MPSGWPRRCHTAACSHAVLITQRPIGMISPFSSAIGMKLSGGTIRAAGPAPAEERLDSGHRLALQIEDRLVEQEELILGEGTA